MSGADEAGQIWTTARVIFRRLRVRGRSVAVGSAVSGNISNVLFDSCTIGDDHGSSPWAFKIKMHVNEPSIVSGITFRDSTFGNITGNTWQDPKCYPAIQMGMNYGGAAVDPAKGQPRISNVSFQNTNATETCTSVGEFVGATEGSITGLHFESCKFDTLSAHPWILENVSIPSCSSKASLPSFP